jgi:hypothetical protein
MVMKIQGLLGCGTIQRCSRIPPFQRSMLPPSSEILVSYYITTWCHNLEDHHLNASNCQDVAI